MHVKGAECQGVLLIHDSDAHMSSMSLKYFEAKVKQAIDSLPTIFLEKMENVEVIIEEFPDKATLDSLGIESPWNLLGLYSGVPLTNQSFFSTITLPQRILLYRQPILRTASTERELSRVIRDVLIHEIGHHFGFDDDELEQMTGDSE
ncbi:MAG: metallopeptidase family protein [Desulfomonilaceae bacterium]